YFVQSFRIFYVNLTGCSSHCPLECINNMIKLIKRTSFDYGSYNHLRNRILLCSKLYAPKTKNESYTMFSCLTSYIEFISPI
ncbi:hypothetical protein Q0N34_14860, partial [Staphylococcus aureus]|nr:hypothetical protein [Staphylococcus aureus]